VYGANNPVCMHRMGTTVGDLTLGTLIYWFKKRACRRMTRLGLGLGSL
jgi:hypothetical protein